MCTLPIVVCVCMCVRACFMSVLPFLGLNADVKKNSVLL